MIYLFFIVIAIMSTVLIEIFSAQKGTVDFGEKIKLYKPCDENIIPFKGKSLVLITIICFAASLVVQVLLYKNTETINFIKLYGLFVLITAAALVDSKRRIIPNIIIVVGLAFRILLYVYEFLTAEDVKAILINDLIGLGIGFGLLAVVSLLSKGALGFGDVKLFGVIGIVGGAFCTYSTLLASLLISLVVSIIGLARKKMGRKDAFPFGPCIAIGYVITVLLSSY